MRHSRRNLSASACALPIVLLALGVPLQGCGSSSQNTNLLLNIVILLITRAAGGIVKDNNTTLTIPPNSLQADTTIKVQPATGLPASPAGLYLVPDTAYTYSPAGTTFSPPATLTVTYASSSVPSFVQTDTIGLYSVSGTTYTRVTASTVNTATSTVTTPLAILGTYVLMGVMPIQDPP